MGLGAKRQCRKKYRYANCKRKNKNRKKTPTIQCDPIKKEWVKKSSVRMNMADMGLSYDSNISIPIPKTTTDPLSSHESRTPQITTPPSKVHVMQALEEDAKAPRQRQFRLPKGHVEWITYLLDKYGEDYKAMVRDPKNYNQETWKQLRAKVKQFKGIPEQFEEYLKLREQKELGYSS